MSDTPPASPCIRVCTLDDNGVCLGCQRTIDEIIRWSNLSAEAQRAILAALPGRRRERPAGTAPERAF